MDWITAPWSTDLVTRAGLELVLVGVIGGVLGVLVVIRGMAFTVEAFAHTAFPGAVLAAVMGGSIVAGGAAAALAAAAGIALLGRSTRAGDETVIGVVFTGMFATGVLLASALGPLDRDITSFLFGSILGVSDGDLWVTGLVAAGVVAGAVGMRRALVAVTFDRESAAADGTRTGLVDAFVLVALALGVVVASRAVGTVLVLALFVTPAASARLVARRVWSTVAAAVAYGIAAGLGGLYLSYHAAIAIGGAVVLTATALFAVTWLASPSARPLAWRARHRAARPAPR